VDLQYVVDTGQKSDRQKVVMLPNGWLYKKNSPCHNSDSDQQLLPKHNTNPISAPANVTPDFQKKNIYIYILSQNA
jgi:hypothetical protein